MAERNKTNEWIFRIEMRDEGEKEQFQVLLKKAKEVGFQVSCVSHSGDEMWVELSYQSRDANLNKNIQFLVALPGVKGGKWIQLKNSHSFEEDTGTQIGALLLEA